MVDITDVPGGDEKQVAEEDAKIFVKVDGSKGIAMDEDVYVTMQGKELRTSESFTEQDARRRKTQGQEERE